MIFRMPGEVSIDNKAILRNFRVNIQTDSSQIRCKFDIINNNEPKPIDLIIYHYSFKMSKLNPHFVLSGINNMTKDKIDLTISFNPVQMRFVVTGTIGNKKANLPIYSLNHIADIMKIILDI